MLSTALVPSSALAQAKGGATKPAAKPDAAKPDAAKPDAAKPEPPKPTDTAGAGAGAAGAAGTGAAGDAPPPVTSTVEPPHDAWDNTNVEELPGKTYMFIGLRYRGNVIPKFMLNMFVDEGKTVYSNTVGVELDLRKDGFSLIPALSFSELGTGDILFKQKGTKDIPGNYSMVNSSMKIIYATADLLWSAKISKNVDFEYGAGFGLGVVFGDLVNNWVKEDSANGHLYSDSGKRFTPCTQVEGRGTGCNAADHQNSDVNKVNNYVEKDWFSGGSKPVLFPWIAVPQFGLRFKPIKEFVGRLGIGFALTGFWFGLSGEYGLEKKPVN